MPKTAYFISDVHGDISGVEELNKLATTDEKAYFLGDLFLGVLGNEINLLNLVNQMIKEDRMVFIMGNHDLILKTILFSDEVTRGSHNLSKHCRLKEVKPLIGLYNQNSYQIIYNALADYKVNRDFKLYNEIVKREINKPENAGVTASLKTLFDHGMFYYNLKLGDKQVLLTHSGHKFDVYTRSVLSSEYKLANQYDLSICGHLNIEYIYTYRRKVRRPVPNSSVVKGSHDLDGISIEGIYKYITPNKTVLIDSGTGQNIIKITAD